MSDTKSSYARNYISKSVIWDEISEDYIVTESIALEAICFAEEDTKSIAIAAFKEWLKEANPYWSETPEGKETIAKFTQKLKTGQENE